MDFWKRVCWRKIWCNLRLRGGTCRQGQSFPSERRQCEDISRAVRRLPGRRFVAGGEGNGKSLEITPHMHESGGR